MTRVQSVTHSSELKQIVIAMALGQRCSLLILAIPVVVMVVVVSGVVSPTGLALRLYWQWSESIKR